MDFIFTVGFTHVRTSIESSFPGRDHLPVSCTFVLFFHSSMPSLIPRPYSRARWGPLPTLLFSCNWDSLILASEMQMANGKFYSISHKCLDSIDSAQPQSMNTKMNSYNRISYKIAKLQKDFPLFLPLNRLSKQLETIMESSSKTQKLRALNHPNPQAAVAEPVK